MSRASKTNQNRTTSPLFGHVRRTPTEILIPGIEVFIATVLLLAIGVVMVFSASSITDFVEAGDAKSEVIKQVLFIGIGIAAAIALIAMVKVFGFDFLLFDWPTLVYWGVCMTLIAMTAVGGTKVLGATRWLMFGDFSIQPSEFAKIAFVLMGVRIVMKYQAGAYQGATLFDSVPFGAVPRFLVCVVAPLAFLLVTQSDLGTVAICFVAVLTLLYLGGIPFWIVALITVCCVALGLVAIGSSPYRLARVTSFMDPWSDNLDSGYQLVHSLQALAAGELTGEGIGNSLEKMQYLPEAETDFIFAIIGEETGLVGTVLVCALFFVWLWGGLGVARMTDDPAAGVVAGSLAVMLVFQAFLNICCVIGWFPITGKPLPFISSGGSSVISSCMIVGILLAVSASSYSDDSEERRGKLRVVSQQSVEPAQGHMRQSPGSPVRPGRPGGYGKSVDRGSRGRPSSF